MNIPAILETAIAEMIRMKAETGGSTSIRTWQNLRVDSKWDADPRTGDRDLPCVDIRAAPPVSDGDTANMTCTVTIEIRTSVHDDQDHREISAIYGSIQSLIDAIFDDFYGEGGEALDLFRRLLDAGAGQPFPFGGVAYADTSPPWDDDGNNVISLGAILHYSRIALRAARQETDNG